MGTVRVGEENSTSIDLHYEDRGTGSRWSSSTASR
jgi:hypothetical protein